MYFHDVTQSLRMISHKTGASPGTVAKLKEKILVVLPLYSRTRPIRNVAPEGALVLQRAAA